MRMRSAEVIRHADQDMEAAAAAEIIQEEAYWK